MKQFNMNKAEPIIVSASESLGKLIKLSNPDAPVESIAVALREITSRLVRNESIVVAGDIEDITPEPMGYNLAADALAMGYAFWQVGDKKQALKMIASAMEVEDADQLFNSLAELNTEAVKDLNLSEEKPATEAVDDEEITSSDDEDEEDPLDAEIDEVISSLDDDLESAEEIENPHTASKPKTTEPPEQEQRQGKPVAGLHEAISGGANDEDEEDNNEVEEDEEQPEVISSNVDRKALAMANKISMSGSKSAVARGLQVITRYKQAS